MGDVRRHLRRAALREHLLALDERAPALHQVVHNHHVPPLGVPLLELHDALVPLPDLRADHLLLPLREGPELPVEALPGALVRVGDDDVHPVGEVLERAEEEREARLEVRLDEVAEVEALLRGGVSGGACPGGSGLRSMHGRGWAEMMGVKRKRGPGGGRERKGGTPTRLEGVDVEDDELGGPAAAERGVGEDAGEGERRRNLPLVLHALEGARREEREHLRAAEGWEGERMRGGLDSRGRRREREGMAAVGGCSPG